MIHASHAAYSSLGLGEQYDLLDSEQVEERIRVTKVAGGLFARENASLHPARLVRGIARAIERRGGVIYEKTEVTNFRVGSSAILMTQGGEVRPKRALVLAGESYLSQLPQLHRVVLPIYSLITLTEPLSPQQWAAIGWGNRESVASCNYTVDYLTRTADGRILFGSRGAPYRIGSAISDDQELHAQTHAHIEDLLVEWFPVLKGIRFTHHWGGPVGMPRDWLPMVTFDPTARIATARGYTGQGVSTSNLTGRILGELISGRKTALGDLPIAERQSPLWEVEPLRWLAVRYMQDAFRRIDEAGKKGNRAPVDARLAMYIGRH
jgi:glycine/D-amino acid oxidase-like deaminating enzyme